MDRHIAKAGGIDLRRRGSINKIKAPLCLLFTATVMVSCAQPQRQLINTVTVAGVQLDLLGEDQRSGTFGNNRVTQQRLLVRCHQGNKIIYRQTFWPGPSWDILTTSNRISIRGELLVIRGPKNTVTVPRNIYRNCPT